MTRDLFPGTRQVRGPLRPRDDAAQRQPPEIVQRGPAERNWFYRLGRKTWSVDELYRLVGFNEACLAHPDSDIFVVVDNAADRPHAYLVELPRNHPSRFDAQGRRDPARVPFWAHGEVIHLQNEAHVPP